MRKMKHPVHSASTMPTHIASMSFRLVFACGVTVIMSGGHALDELNRGLHSELVLAFTTYSPLSVCTSESHTMYVPALAAVNREPLKFLVGVFQSNDTR